MSGAFSSRGWYKDDMLTHPRCHYCYHLIGNDPSVGTYWHGEHTRRATVDHIVPRAMGGSNYRDNLVLACHSCNKDRGTTLGVCWCPTCINAWADQATRWLDPERTSGHKFTEDLLSA